MHKGAPTGPNAGGSSKTFRPIFNPITLGPRPRRALAEAVTDPPQVSFLVGRPKTCEEPSGRRTDMDGTSFTAAMPDPNEGVALLAPERQPQFDTPVVFFIFNRPETTRRVFEAIRQIRPKKLLVVGDGPRDSGEEAVLCEQTRAILKDIDWDCELHTDLPETNLGVPHRFASAFEWIFGLVDEAIILEHDCLPHPDFFPYCAELLRHYRDDPRVMWIGGTNPVPEAIGNGSYFLPAPTGSGDGPHGSGPGSTMTWRSVAIRNFGGTG
jgi:hypothetical protein